MKPRLFLSALLAILFAFGIGESAFGVGAAHAQQFPRLTGRVVDAANLLSPEQEAQLTQLSQEIETDTSRQFVVVTVPDLQGYEISDYGYRLGRYWEIGQKDANNGIILIVAPNERKVRIEVGYGLEPVMPDAMANRIIRDDILPQFRAGDMPAGIMAGAQAIGEQMKLPLEAAEERARQQAADDQSGEEGEGWVLMLFWGFVLLFIILPAIFGKRGRRFHGGGPIILWDNDDDHWGGGGSSWGGGGGGGGGGFSGGGGSFGGGGASGSW